MLPFPDMLHLLPHELTGLRAGRLAFCSILVRSFDSLH